MKSNIIAKRRRRFFAAVTALIMSAANLSVPVGAYMLDCISYDPDQRKLRAEIVAEEGDLPLENKSLIYTINVKPNMEKPPSCTEEGFVGYESGSMGSFNVINNGNTEAISVFESGSVRVPALGHNYTSEVTTPATCVSTGVMKYTCSRCLDTYNDTIPVIEHNTAANGSAITVSYVDTEHGGTIEATLTIAAPALAAYGGSGSAGAVLDGTADFKAATGMNVSASDIVYSGTLSDGTAYAESSEPPTNAGTYAASITVDGATASVNYTISKADPVYVIPESTATYGDTLADAALAEGWKWADDTQKVGDAGINAFSAVYTPDDKVNYNTVTADVSVKVEKAEPSCTAPTAIEGLEYTGKAQALLTAGSTSDGKMLYSSDGEGFNSDIPKGTNAGSYTAYWKVQGDKNHLDSEVNTISVTIAPADAQGAPIPNVLTYNGKPQELVKAGEAEGGEMQYALGEDGDYSADIPTAVDAGSYTVYYKIKGDSDHNDTEPQAMNISIAKAPQEAPVLEHTDETAAGKNDGTISGLAEGMQMSTTGAEEDYTDVSDTVLTDLAPGTYYVRYAGNDNLLASEAEAVTIKAGRNITITFDTDGGTEIPAITGAYGTAVNTPEDPVKEGYAFAGWDRDIPETMPAEDMTVTALWNINSYTIIFNTDGGSQTAPINAEYGAAVTAPEDPVKEGFVFAGWDKDIPETMPAENMTINAIWEKASDPYIEPEIEPKPEPEPEEEPHPSKYTSYSTSSYGPSAPSTTTMQDASTISVTIPPVSLIDNKKISAEYVSSRRIRIRWDKIGGAENYSVYYVEGNKEYKIGETTKTVYYVKNAIPGKVYKFRVKYTTKDGISKPSKSLEISIKKTADKPVVSASVKNNKIILKWTKVPNAEKYAVYRLTADGKLKLIAKTDKTNIEIVPKSADKGYAVKALVNGKWTKVTKSDIVPVVEE